MKPSLKPFPGKTALAGFFAVLAAGPVAAPAMKEASLPASLTANYALTISGVELGMVTHQLRREGDAYVVQVRTKPNAVLAFIVGGDEEQTCRFRADDGSVRGESYRLVSALARKKGREYSAEYAWDAREVRLSNGTKLPIPDEATLDDCSMAYALISGGAQAFSKRRLHVIGYDRLRGFIPSSIQSEKVTVPAGTFDTQRLEFKRDTDPNKRLVFWLAPARGNLPVKIADMRQSRTSTLTLKSVEGL
jgi:hypothetical protein